MCKSVLTRRLYYYFVMFTLDFEYYLRIIRILIKDFDMTLADSQPRVEAQALELSGEQIKVFSLKKYYCHKSAGSTVLPVSEAKCTACTLRM